MIDQLLGAWAEENFEAAWAWSQQLEGEGAQNFIASRLLNQLVATDLEHALSLYLELIQINPSLKSEVPEKALAGAALKNADEFLKLAGKFGFSWTTGFACEFAKDFNFQQAADGIIKLPGREDSRLPLGFPKNFYEAWAERDREAAFKSFIEGKLDRAGGLYGFLNGLEKHNPSEAVWGWVAEKI